MLPDNVHCTCAEHTEQWKAIHAEVSKAAYDKQEKARLADPHKKAPQYPSTDKRFYADLKLRRYTTGKQLKSECK